MSRLKFLLPLITAATVLAVSCSTAPGSNSGSSSSSGGSVSYDVYVGGMIYPSSDSYACYWKGQERTTLSSGLKSFGISICVVQK